MDQLYIQCGLRTAEMRFQQWLASNARTYNITKLGFILQDLTKSLYLYGYNSQNELPESLKVNALQQIVNELHEMNSKE